VTEGKADPLFKKLNHSSQTVIHVLNAPASFAPELEALAGVEVLKELKGPTGFVMVLVVTKAEVDAASTLIASCTEGDAVIWMAYPKGTTRNYRGEFNRVSGWAVLGAAGYEAVRQVTIVADWSAMRVPQGGVHQDDHAQSGGCDLQGWP
jgi:hypothetical protein